MRLDGKSKPISYWSFENALLAANQNIKSFNDDEVLSNLERLLSDAVGLQMQADVSLGAFLSGGVDSSLIVALMQEQSGRRVNSFSIGFDEPEFDEAPFASAVASHIGTDHTELYVSGREAIDVIPKLPALYDEPFSDSSQIPTVILSRMAKDHVTVALSGDAGDELFGGYNRYLWAPSIWRQLRWIPIPIKKYIAAILTSLPPSTLNSIITPLYGLLPSRCRHLNLGERIHKASEILALSSPMDIYLHLISHWKCPDQIVIGASETHGIKDQIRTLDSQLTFEQQMMLLDSQTYLPDDILVKVDRAAMGFSLETRVPFSDHRVIEARMLQMPQHFKIRNGVGKWCLRQLLYKRVPKNSLKDQKQVLECHLTVGCVLTLGNGVRRYCPVQD